MDNATQQNTDLRIWRKTQDPLSPSIHVTKGGDIGINVGGHVIVMPVEKWHALGMSELGLEKAPAEQPHTPASLLDWAETLLCNSQPSSDINPTQWHYNVKAWRDDKNAPPVPPSPQTAQIQEWMADLDALLSRIDASRDYPYRGGHLVDCRAAAITHLHEARHWLIADLGHQRAQATDEKFIRAGHKPEDQSCGHAAWLAIPQPRPRHCPTCDTCMWDAGD